ncbi:Phosphoenolpyruvate carboxylase family protein [Perilla frutescens var. hirtella]|nr:Phosphoenolpyruvate carboxylase family protein [Perilla frutescens var. hirtella]
MLAVVGVPEFNYSATAAIYRAPGFSNPSKSHVQRIRLTEATSHRRPPLYSYISRNFHPHIGVTGSSNRRSIITFSSRRQGGDDYAPAPTESLRQLLRAPGIHLGPACFDALSAKLVERAGFDFCFTTGFGISASRLGLPDTGLISYGEMVDQGQQITGAVSIPVIGDGDNGYGNPMNVKRTVKGYIRAGFAGLILEDQVSPKACGHTQGREVISREEAVMRIKAAIDARTESGSDIVIVARTDSRQAVSLEESLWRARAFANAGADVLFIDALASKEEMKAFCEVCPLVPKMANMLEGGGKTPILSPIELSDMGYKLVAYPLSLMGVSIRAMQDALLAIKGGRMPPPGSMPSFEEIKEILGFNAYYEEDMRYSTKSDQPHSRKDYSSTSNSSYSIQMNAQNDTKKRNQSAQNLNVEVVTPEIYSSGVSFSGIWSRKLRVKITGQDGFERLDVRIPAGFLDGITNVVPEEDRDSSLFILPEDSNSPSRLSQEALSMKGRQEKGEYRER